MSQKCHLKRCRAALDIFTDGQGRTVAVCRKCERNKAGLCRGCPKPTPASTGKVKPFWCRDCQRTLDAARHRRARANDPERYRAIHERSRERRTPEQRQARREYSRRWYHAHKKPSTALDRVYKREMARQARQDPIKRARILATRRAYESRPEVREKMRAYRREYYRRFAA